MITKEITICINPGVDCSNIHIDWLGTDGLIIPCQDKNCITIAVDPNNPTQCLEGFIVCLDANGVQSCKNCEPIHFRKCFCTLDSDCGNCGNCGSDGLCKDTCTTEQLAQGQVCYPDGCKCPPNKPILDPKTGKCAECISGTKDAINPCKICIDGKWVTKSCGPDAVCDQSTGDCIDDCSKNINGKTRWNYTTKSCDCEVGYRWSTVKNICVEDTDCNPGYRRNPVTDECEKIICPPGKIFSVEKNDCIDEPCDPKNCENGLDCTGKNCGCSKVTKKCVSCKDDPTALGCNDDKIECKREYCDDSTPCAGKNCTCVKNECVNCNNFPCDKCGLRDGCICIDGVNCKGNDDRDNCPDKHELLFKDCTLQTKLQLNNPCSCDGVGASVKINSFIKTKNTTTNTYKAEFEIDLRKKFTNNITGYQALERFKQSDADINNDFPDTAPCTIDIISYYRDKDNNIFATPLQTLSSEIKTGPSGAKETYVIFKDVLIAEDKPDDIQFPTTFVGYRMTVHIGNISFDYKNCFYERTKIYQTINTGYESIRTTAFPRYITLSNLSTDSKRNPLLTWYRNGEVIRRLFIEPTTVGVYEDKLNGPKKLSLFERGKQELVGPEGELISLKDYTTSWDCGCEKEKTITQVYKCDIKSWRTNEHFKVSTSNGSSVCNNQLLLLKEHIPCFINQDLEYFGWGVNHPSQTKYIVSIIDKKGVKIDAATFVYKNTSETTGYFRKDGTNEQFEGFIYNHTEEISSVSIRMNHDNSCILSDTVTLDLKDAEIKLTCTGAFVRATISSRGTLIKKVEVPELNIISNVTDSGTSQIIIDNLPQNKDIRFVVTYVNNCKKEQTLSKNCCDSDELELSISGIVQKVLSVKTKNKEKLTSILINGTEQISRANDVDRTYSFNIESLNSPTTVNVIVQTQNGCYYSALNFNTGDNYIIDFKLQPNIICSNETSAIIISNAPSNIDIIVKTPNGSTVSGRTDNNGYLEISNISIAGEYAIVRIGNQNITQDEIQKIVLSVKSSPVVNSIEISGASTSFCANSDIDIIIKGTLNSIVDLEATKIGFLLPAPGIVLDTPIVGYPNEGYGIARFKFSEQGTYTIKSIRSTDGNCSSISEKTLSVNVDQNIQIVNFESICQAPLGPNASVKIIVTLLSGITNITVTGKLLDTNSNLITFDNPTLPNTFEAIVPGGSGKNIEISVTANSCKVTETYTLNSCNCSVNPPIPIFNNYLSCFPNGSVDIINNLVGGGQYGIDLYYESDPVPVKRLTAADSSYQILYPGQFGTYRGVSIDLATQCKTVGPSFTVSSGDFMVDFGVTTSPICAGTALILNAVVSGGYFTEQMLFKWFVNNVEQIGETSSVFTYIHPEGLGDSSVQIKVEARRNSYNLSSIVVSSSCIKSVSKTVNFSDCCPHISIVYNGFESTQCNGIVANISAATSNTNENMYYELYYPDSSNTIISSGTSILSNQKINISRETLSPGINNYRLKVGFVNNPSCYKELTFSHNSIVPCDAANYIFIIDNSGSITTEEFLAIRNQILFLANTLHQNNSQNRFAIAHYFTIAESSTAADSFIVTGVGQTDPNLSIIRQAVGNDFLQRSLQAFDITTFTGLDDNFPTKLIIFSDASGKTGSEIGDGKIWESDPNYSVHPNYGVNKLFEMPFPTTNTLKSLYDIYLVRYPHYETSSQFNLQEASDTLFKRVVSQEENFFGSNYNNNSAILGLLNGLGCNCS